MAGCDNSTQYNLECTSSSKGTCKDCAKVCPSDQYVVNCGGLNRRGTCLNCSYCNATSYSLGCGGLSKGTCVQCSHCGPGRYAEGCSGNSSGTCRDCQTQERGYTTGCALNSPGSAHVCGDNCAPNQYALGCGGSNPGNCTPCVNSAQPGYYFSSCEKDSPGGNLPCPKNTYSNAPGATSSSTCLNCSANAVSEPGSTFCECNKGTFSASGSQADCTFCPLGSYQDTAGTTGCKQCDSGSYTNVIGSSSRGDCKPCDAIPTNSHWNGVFSKVNDVVYCQWDCNTDYRKSGSVCVSTITVPPSTPQPTSARGTSAAVGQTTKAVSGGTTAKPQLPGQTAAPGTTPDPTPAPSAGNDGSNTTVIAASIAGVALGGMLCAVAAYYAMHSNQTPLAASATPPAKTTQATGTHLMFTGVKLQRGELV